MLDALYFAAWNDLSTERPIGFGEGPIPHSKIADYGSHYIGLEGDHLEFFITVIRKVDGGLSSSATTADGKMREVVSMTDVAGVKGLLARLAAPKGKGDRFRKSARPPRE